MTYKILSPDKCDSQQLKKFYDIVVEGGQVLVDGLENRIKGAELLSFCESESEVVGVASIKKPDNAYKKNIFRQANVEELSGSYNFEIGYAVTKETHRRKGISEQLIKSLMENSNSKSFYATTKNDGMRHLLEKIGFTKLGNNYLNSDNETLTLYHINTKWH
ncbi:putative GNAT family N-acyltransferase [Arcicella rosea]|uniref:GNAT family N-acetyltransferase n=1 Tax=Arcicella rosea TaxID=502909 RepID=UPI00345CC128